MSLACIDIPKSGSYVLTNVRVPISVLSAKVAASLMADLDHEGAAPVSVSVSDEGVVSSISSVHVTSPTPETQTVDCEGKHLWTRFCDAHTHLDKTQT
ncbi:MAG: hypothetical protein AAFQ12_11080 [Pseudomonadota bacterium]